MKTTAVIGACFGDEGKGRTVDDLLADIDPLDALVVRHNSSAQAGHTVNHGDRRHVFSHFGSGTLRGVPTYLGPKFVINPVVFAREWGELEEIGVSPTTYFSSQCLITTPYDTAANQVMEIARARGVGRHGSCGIGFGQTIFRDLNCPHLSIHAGRIPWGTLKQRLRDIRDFHLGWLPVVREIDHPAATFLLDTEPNLAPWLDDLCFVVDRLRGYDPHLSGRETIIFEGAQGLMLDQAHRFFPHVTRCSTGLTDIIDLATEMGRPEIEAHYVMRPYLTRHGAGPLPAEVDGPPVPDFADATNVPNDWQGTLRFGLLDPKEQIGTIMTDMRTAAGRNSNVVIRPSLTMTCLDQLGDKFDVDVMGNRYVNRMDARDVARFVGGAIGAIRVDGTFGAAAGRRCELTGAE